MNTDKNQTKDKEENKPESEETIQVVPPTEEPSPSTSRESKKVRRLRKMEDCEEEEESDSSSSSNGSSSVSEPEDDSPSVSRQTKGFEVTVR